MEPNYTNIKEEGLQEYYMVSGQNAQKDMKTMMESLKWVLCGVHRVSDSVLS